MLPKIARTALIIFCFVFGAVGVAASPLDAMIFWSLLGAMAGVCVWLGAGELTTVRKRTGWARSEARWGAVVTGAVITAYLEIVGMVTVLGVAAAVSVVVIVAATWAYRRFRPAPVRRATAPRTQRPTVEPPAAEPVRATASLSADELCLAWRRSYFDLQKADDEDARHRVVQRRQDYLDELERRDRKGFVRWLDSGARAGGDPQRYLTADG